MNTIKYKLFQVTFVLMVVLLSVGYSNAQGTCLSCAPSVLTAEEISNLQYMYDEETVALDYYLAMNALWQQRSFSSIAVAEKKHAAALLKQLNIHGIAPLEGMDPNLVTIKNELLNRGSQSLLEAYLAAGLIEEQDIADLKEAIIVTKAPELVKVYNNLKTASENHLRAIAKNVKALGSEYVAQLLPIAEVNAITGIKSGKGSQKNNKNNKQIHKKGANKKKGASK